MYGLSVSCLLSLKTPLDTLEGENPFLVTFSLLPLWSEQSSRVVVNSIFLFQPVHKHAVVFIGARFFSSEEESLKKILKHWK